VDTSSIGEPEPPVAAGSLVLKRKRTEEDLLRPQDGSPKKGNPRQLIHQLGETVSNGVGESQAGFDSFFIAVPVAPISPVKNPKAAAAAATATAATTSAASFPQSSQLESPVSSQSTTVALGSTEDKSELESLAESDSLFRSPVKSKIPKPDTPQLNQGAAVSPKKDDPKATPKTSPSSASKTTQLSVKDMFMHAMNKVQPTQQGGSSLHPAPLQSPPPARSTSKQPPPSGKSTSPKKLGPPSDSPTKLVQSFLDLGQKNFGPIVCPVCRMTYQRGQQEDEEMHAKFHKSHDKGIPFPGWKNEKEIATFGGDRIIVVTDDALAAQQKKVKEIIDHVNDELGAVMRDTSSLAGFKVYLYISAKKEVVGCLVGERISHAHKLIPGETQTGQSFLLLFGAFVSITHSNSPLHLTESGSSYGAQIDLRQKYVALCGINRIWVKASERKSGIATKLVDAMCGDFIFQCPIELSQLAFSQPTESGRAFAQKYTGVKDFLVYTEGQSIK